VQRGVVEAGFLKSLTAPVAESTRAASVSGTEVLEANGADWPHPHQFQEPSPSLGGERHSVILISLLRFKRSSGSLL
jgi:hypothetical protein